MLRNGEYVHYDEWGNEYVIDEEGNHRPPMQAAMIKPGDFAPYDDSRGHCAMCGSLTCRGNCIQGGS